MIKKLAPHDGGCWFCHLKDGHMSFSYEFDTYYHVECLLYNVRKALAKNDLTNEAWIMADELYTELHGIHDNGDLDTVKEEYTYAFYVLMELFQAKLDQKLKEA